MKQFVFSLALFASLLSGCEQAEEDSAAIEVAVLYDQTDTMLLRPDTKRLLGLFDFANHTNRAAGFYAAPITDRKLNEAYRVQLPDAVYTEAHNETDDVSYRTTCISAFSANVDSVLTKLINPPHAAPSLANTECMSSIARALWKLSTSKAPERVLCIYSDLMENAALSLYSTGPSRSLKDTAAIAERLLKEAPLPDRLTGITVWLLYRPPSREADLRYSVISAAYRNLLTGRGASVSVSATNDFSTP